MGSPFNYGINLPQLNDPSVGVINAINAARGIRQTQLEGEKLKLAKQESERKQQQQKQMQSDLLGLSENPDSESIAKMMIRYPEYAENLSKAYDLISPEEKQSKIGEAAQLYASLNAGRPDIAKEILQEKVEAYRNAGNEQEAKIHERYLKIVDENPNQAKVTAGLMLSAQMGPKEFIKTFKGLGEEGRAEELQDPTLREAEAEADVARLEADYKEDQIVGDLQKQGWDIEKIRNEIQDSKANTSIRALESQIKRESNALRKQELEARLEKMKMDKEQAQRDKVASFKSSNILINNSIMTLDNIIENPELDNVLGSVEGSKFYPSTLMGLINPLADSDKRVDVLADIESVRGQQFVSNLLAAKASGAAFGSLTEREGKKLEELLISLQTRQSESKFKENLIKLRGYLQEEKRILSERYGAPDVVMQQDEIIRDPATGQPELPPMPEAPTSNSSGFRVIGVE